MHIPGLALFLTMELIEQLLAHKDDLDAITPSLPCYVHINNTTDFALVYSSPQSRELMQLRNSVRALTYDESLGKVHPDDLARARRSCRQYLNNLDEFSTVSFLQRIMGPEGKYILFFTTSKYIPELGGLVSFSFDLSEQEVNQKQVSKIVEETDFIKQHFMEFSTLGQKERALIRLWVQNEPPGIIARTLGITEQTVKTYKKRIYQKLNIQSQAELFTYATAFDLI